jgi:hypothetical protein
MGYHSVWVPRERSEFAGALKVGGRRTLCMSPEYGLWQVWVKTESVYASWLCLLVPVQ